MFELKKHPCLFVCLGIVEREEHVKGGLGSI